MVFEASHTQTHTHTHNTGGQAGASVLLTTSSRRGIAAFRQRDPANHVGGSIRHHGCLFDGPDPWALPADENRGFAQGL